MEVSTMELSYNSLQPTMIPPSSCWQGYTPMDTPSSWKISQIFPMVIMEAIRILRSWCNVFSVKVETNSTHSLRGISMTAMAEMTLAPTLTMAVEGSISVLRV
jgi:hypothetical protein